jgi:transposase
MLALATVLQYLEGLSDRQAADAVQGRIDWKYALRLSLTDPGFDHTVLSEFRSRLIEGKAEQQLLDTLLDRWRDLGLVKPRGRQRTDSTHVLAAVRGLNRLERVGETLRAALNEVAVMAPAWLQALAPAEWYERYASRVENYRLPKTDAARQDLAPTIGADGGALMAAIDQAPSLPWLAKIPAVQALRRVWAEQYVQQDGQVRWRDVKEMPPPATMISSPYDTDARYSTKRESSWLGYKVHLTESCDADVPHVIVNVETTAATTPDDNMLAVIHKSLEARDLLPAEHLVDKGYTDAGVLIDSQRDYVCNDNYPVAVIGPVADDPSWQAREYHEALQAARKRQDTAEFRESYAARAGIEATPGQAVRRCALRRCRYIGLAKTHLQHLISAAPINFVRIANWVNGIPTAQTRCSWFAALQKAA